MPRRDFGRPRPMAVRPILMLTLALLAVIGPSAAGPQQADALAALLPTLGTAFHPDQALAFLGDGGALRAVAGWRARTSSAAMARAEDLIGVWTGRWTAADGLRGGAVELILAQEPGVPTVIAHVTFVDGGLSDTVRREGRLTGQGLHFALVGGGTLVLRLESGRRLTGDFAGGPDVPAPLGSLELTRKT